MLLYVCFAYYLHFDKFSAGRCFFIVVYFRFLYYVLLKIFQLRFLDLASD